jgi:PAS domain S-box-containing protein
MVSRRLSISLEHELFQRKKAERDLKKSLQILRDTGAMAKIGGWEFDVATQDQEWTEEVYRIHEVDMNYKPTARNGIDFYAPTSRPIIELAVQRAIEYQESFDLELEIITAQGNLRWVHVVGKADQEHGKVIGTFQDITERKRAEEQIHRNETRLMSLLNIIQHHAKTTQEFLDYALNEVIKLTQSKIGYIYLYHEDRRQFILNTWSKDVMKEYTIANPQTCYELEKTGVWAEAVRQRKPIVLNDFQADHPLKKGYPVSHAHLNKFLTVPIFKDDQIVAVVGVANKASNYDETDVLQLTLFMDSVWKSVNIKMSEENLRKSEERFKQLAEVFPETIFEANMRGDVTYTNKHGLNHFGLTEEDIAKDVNIFDMVSPGDSKLVRERIQGRTQGASKGYLEYQAMKKDGSIFYALSLSVPIMVDGILIGIRGFILDINKRKQAEEALRESEARISAITNFANDAITMMDNNGNISYWNPAAEHILGYTSAEAIGRNLHELITPERFLATHLAAFPEFQIVGSKDRGGMALRRYYAGHHRAQTGGRCPS